MRTVAQKLDFSSSRLSRFTVAYWAKTTPTPPPATTTLRTISGRRVASLMPNRSRRSRLMFDDVPLGMDIQA